MANQIPTTEPNKTDGEKKKKQKTLNVKSKTRTFQKNYNIVVLLTFFLDTVSRLQTTILVVPQGHPVLRRELSS